MEVMVDVGLTTIVAVLDFVGSCSDVAVMAACVAAVTVGAVKTPELDTVPVLAFQVTEELKFPFPCTPAVH